MHTTTQAFQTTAPDQLTIRDPRTGDVVGTFASARPEDVGRAVAAARAAQPAWSATPPAERGRLLRAAAAALDEKAAELAEINARETGRPVEEARAGVAAGVATLEQYAELGPVHRGHSLRGNTLAADYTAAEPRGVAVLLTPWNDPVAVACGLIGAALVTGNTVVHKPSERCPRVGERLGEVLASAFPPDVLQTLTGGADVGSLLTQQPSVDVFAHVGSSDSGARIAQAAVLTGAHVIRENGGNDPLVVDEDVDPEWAAEQAAVGAFSNSGQICTSVERIYVHRAVAEPFCDALAAQARTPQPGRDRAAGGHAVARDGPPACLRSLAARRAAAGGRDGSRRSWSLLSRHSPARLHGLHGGHGRGDLRPGGSGARRGQLSGKACSWPPRAGTGWPRRS